MGHDFLFFKCSLGNLCPTHPLEIKCTPRTNLTFPHHSRFPLTLAGLQNRLNLFVSHGKTSVFSAANIANKLSKDAVCLKILCQCVAEISSVQEESEGIKWPGNPQLFFFYELVRMQNNSCGH